MARVVILGAGLTGLSAAYHLEQKNFLDFKIFEKNKISGGLARSIKHEGFTFDFTGHLLHCNNTYAKSLIDKILPKNSRNKIARNSFAYTKNRFVKYPFQMNLFGLPTQTIAECICGFAKRKHQIKNPQNFYEWVLKHFGAGFAKHFFFPYNSKILQYNLKKIHPSWTGNFVPKTTIKDLIENLSREEKTKSIGYNHHFYYPKKNGIQFFADSFRNNIKKEIKTNYNAVEVNLKNKTVFFENGHKEKFETLITTIPLDNLLKKIVEPSNLNIKKTKEKLFCNSVINFNIGFKPENFTDKHWIYIPEKKYNFYRLGFWDNFSKDLVPKNCSAMYGEISYVKKFKNKYKISELKKTTSKSIKQACDIFEIKQSDIVTQKILHIQNAYVIYDIWREKNLCKIHKILNKHAIYSVGRYGEWKYSSMQDAILDGRNIAKIITKSGAKFVPATKEIETVVLPNIKEKQKREKTL